MIIFVFYKQDWMSPLKATRNSDTVTLLIRDDSNVGAALIHSAFRDIASLTRRGADKMESRIFDIWPWHCLLQKPDHTSVLALECCTLNIRKPQRITISNSKLSDQISNIQSSYANTDNSGHETDEGEFLISWIYLICLTNTVSDYCWQCVYLQRDETRD